MGSNGNKKPGQLPSDKAVYPKIGNIARFCLIIRFCLNIETKRGSRNGAGKGASACV